MKILTIIVSYNFERWMDACLGSLRRSTHPTDVLVVDNASQDDTLKLLQERYPEVRVVANRENLGFGRANNIGMEIALAEGYDAVFLLNQDAWIDEHVLATLSSFEMLERGYILSPVHLDGSGKCLDSGFSNYAKLSGLDDLKGKSSYVEVDFLNAAFWFIPCSVLKVLGGFSPLFQHYGEDVDYINRATRYGYRIGYFPNVFGCHDRAARKVERKAWLYAEYVYHLTEYANVLHNFFWAFGKGVLALWKKAFKALLKGKLLDVYDYMLLSFRLIGRTKAVWKHRQCVLTVGGSGFFLNVSNPKSC